MALKHFTDQNFQKEVLEFSGLTLVDFWAPWCGPCQMMGPVIDQLAEEYSQDSNLKIGKMNVDENEIYPSRYGIMSIPTLIFFKNGKPVDQLIGFQSKEVLQAKINELLKMK